MKRWGGGRAWARRCVSLVAVLLGIACVLLMFAATHAWFGGGAFLSRTPLTLLAWYLPAMLLIRQWHLARQPFEPHELGRPVSLTALTLVLLMGLMLFSNTGRHPWFYLMGWFPGPEAPGGGLWPGLARYVFLTLLFTPLFLLYRRRIDQALAIMLCISMASCAIALFSHTHALPLYRDDHPSFMFRLWEAARTFPHRVTYNPYWNGGVVNAVTTSSGTYALGLPLLPLWRWLPVHRVYTPALALLFIGVMPLLALLSLRLMRASRTAALVAAVLTLGVSRFFFVWMLHFGTVGATFAAAFLLPVTALSYRIVVLRDRSRRTALGLILALSLLLQWPPGALMALPLGLSVLLAWRRWTRRSIATLTIVAGVTGILMLPALVAILHKSELMAHVMASANSREIAHPVRIASGDWRAMLNAIGKQLIETHPLIIFLGLAGVVALPYHSVRRWVWPVMLALLGLVMFGPVLKPNLQLERMAIPLMLVAVVPTSLWVGRLLRTGNHRASLARASVFVMLFMGSRSVTQLYAGRGYAPYHAMPPLVERLSDWVRTQVPEGARVMFAGRCVHFYGGGHVAYLPALAEREMMACDYYAFPITTVEYEYPPRPFRDSEAGIRRFADLYNVTHILTYHTLHAQLLGGMTNTVRALPDFREDGIALFEVQREASPFLVGQGSVHADFNRIDIELTEAFDEVVITYNWIEQMRARDGVELFPYDAGDGVRLIGIRPHGERSIALRFKSLL